MYIKQIKCKMSFFKISKYMLHCRITSALYILENISTRIKKDLDKKILNHYIHMFILLYFYISFVCISNSEIEIFKLNFKLNDTIVFFSFFGNWWHLFQKFLNYKSILLNKKKWKFITMLMSSVHRFCKGRELVETVTIFIYST